MNPVQLCERRTGSGPCPETASHRLLVRRRDGTRFEVFYCPAHTAHVERLMKQRPAYFATTRPEITRLAEAA